MNLIPEEIGKTIPKLYEQDGKEGDAIVYAKFYIGNWIWYVLEYDPDEKRCYGYIIGQAKEFGYFSLTELEELRIEVDVENIGTVLLTVERDEKWIPKSLKEIEGIRI